MEAEDQVCQESYIKIHQHFPKNRANSSNIKTIKLDKCHTIVSSEKDQAVLSTLDKCIGCFEEKNLKLYISFNCDGPDGPLSMKLALVCLKPLEEVYYYSNLSRLYIGSRRGKYGQCHIAHTYFLYIQTVELKCKSGYRCITFSCLYYCN